jgi:hypothetical protein
VRPTSPTQSPESPTSRSDTHRGGTKLAQTNTRCNPRFLTAQANALERTRTNQQKRWSKMIRKTKSRRKSRTQSDTPNFAGC